MKKERNKVEKEKQKRREARKQELGSDYSSSDDDSDNDGTHKAPIQSLRVREDTAKYLRNLDTDSAFYDQKTRSMRANPTPWLAPEESTWATH